MANVNRLRNEITNLELRRDELTKERQEALNGQLTARQAVITGKASVSTLESNQIKLNAYDSTISTIESQIADKRLKLENSIVQERADTLFRDAVSCAKAAKAGGDNCADAVKGFSNSMGKADVDKYLDGRAEIYRAKERVNSIIQDLIPGVQSTIYKSNPEAEKALEIFWTELEAETDCSILRSNHLIVEYAFPLLDYAHNTYEMPLNLYPDTFRTALRERAARIEKEKT